MVEIESQFVNTSHFHVMYMKNQIQRWEISPFLITCFELKVLLMNLQSLVTLYLMMLLLCMSSM